MSEQLSQVMVFAAGFGTRMGALTKDRPKPLIEVSGKPLIDHALGHAAARGNHALVNAHYRADQIESYLRNRRDVAVITEYPDILETGGGLKNALSFLGGNPLFTLNSDAIWRGPSPLDLLEQHWAPERMEALLLIVPTDRVVGHGGAGDFAMHDSGQIERCQPGLVYTGAQILKTDRVRAISEDAFSLNIVWDQMLDDGTLYGVEYPGHWADVGSPDGIAQAERLIDDV